MKKYFFSLLAIAIAVGFSAFSTKSPDVFFKFTGSVTNPTDVANELKYVEQSAITCSGDEKACGIIVDENDITGTPNTSRTLSAHTSVLIDAQLGSSQTINYVPVENGSNTVPLSIDNQP